MCACVTTLLRYVLMCGRQWAQVIDNGPLSMLGNEISSARFVGLRKPKRTEREGKREREEDGWQKIEMRWRDKREERVTPKSKYFTQLLHCSLSDETGRGFNIG